MEEDIDGEKQLYTILAHNSFLMGFGLWFSLGLEILY